MRGENNLLLLRLLLSIVGTCSSECRVQGEGCQLRVRGENDLLLLRLLLLLLLLCVPTMLNPEPRALNSEAAAKKHA